MFAAAGITVVIPLRHAASTFSGMPSLRRSWPTSPRIPHDAETRAVTMVTPADGPSSDLRSPARRRGHHRASSVGPSADVSTSARACSYSVLVAGDERHAPLGRGRLGRGARTPLRPFVFVP